MSTRVMPLGARRGDSRAPQTDADPREPGEVESMWRDQRDPLPALLRVSRVMSGEASHIEIVGECLQTLCHLAGGKRAAMLVGTDELAGVAGAEANGAREVEIAPGAELVVDGDLAQIICDWEGNARPVMLEHGARLVLPLAHGGVVVEHPEGGIMLDQDRLQALEILLNQARYAVSLATDLAEISRRSQDLEETRRRLREQTMLLTELTVVDALTGLHNRRYLERQLTYEVERFQRYVRPLSLAMLDVDFFKKVNDTYGHPVGDAVLRGLADVGRKTIRKLDLLARVGGEEFALLMPETDHAGAMVCCNRLLNNVRAAEFSDGRQTLKVTISIGVASVHHPWAGDQESLVRTADQALYRAKESGRNRIVWTNLGEGVAEMNEEQG